MTGLIHAWIQDISSNYISLSMFVKIWAKTTKKYTLLTKKNLFFSLKADHIWLSNLDNNQIWLFKYQNYGYKNRT